MGAKEPADKEDPEGMRAFYSEAARRLLKNKGKGQQREEVGDTTKEDVPREFWSEATKRLMKVNRKPKPKPAKQAQVLKKVWVPPELLERIEALIREHPELGYKDPEDFVRAALERFMAKLELKGRE